MAEQISRRANNVTSAGFDTPFETQIIRFGQGGLNLKDSLDAMEGWSRLTNIWHENEGEATVRPGQTSLATFPAGSTVHSIHKLRTPAGSDFTRFWGVGTDLHREESGTPASIASGFSGDPLALLPHRPPLSGKPWMFVGDRTKMVKARDDSLVVPIGLPAPAAAPASTHGAEYRTAIAMCGPSPDPSSGANWVPAPGTDENDNATDTPAAATDDAFRDGGDGVYMITNPGAAIDSGYDSWWGLPIALDLTTLDVSPSGSPATLPASDDDIIHIWMKSSHPHALAEIRLYFVISATFDPLVLPGTDESGTFANADAYVKAFRPNDYVQFVAAAQPQIDAAEQARVHALRDQDSKARGFDDARDSWEDQRAVSDPARARSFQIGLGSHQWFEYGNIGSPLRRGDFQRIGYTPDRNWSTITGVIIYLKTLPEFVSGIALGVDDIYMTGGYGLDTVEPGMQMYDYRATHYDPRTGAESNGSPEQPVTAHLDSIRRQLVVTPAAYGDAAMRQRLYRRGGTLYDDWYYLGENTSDGGPYTDRFADVDIVAAGTMPIDHFQPVPTVNDAGVTVLNQAVHALWGPIEGMLFACGDPHRPGHVYFNIPGQPDHWSASGNVEVCAPSEELMNGGIAGHQAFVFSRQKLYMLYPNLSGQLGSVTAAPSLCTRGLLGRWSFCVGPGGLVFFVAEDGVFVTQGGPEDWISQDINPLFYGTAVNGYAPIDKTVPTAIRLTCWENNLFFQYQDTGGARQVMVYSILQKFWRHYQFGQQPAVVQGEDEDILLIGGYLTGASYTHDGTSDGGTAISCVVRSGASSGGRREEKLFGDAFLDCDRGATTINVRHFFNEESAANAPFPLSSGEGRQRYILDDFGPSPQKAHSLSTEVSWVGGLPTIFQFGYAITLQPDLTNHRVTNWDDLNSPDETWLTGVTLDVDTGGGEKIVYVERDFGGERIIVDTLHVIANGRHKLKFSWLAVPANQVRLRPAEGGCEIWLLYRADWIYVQEPPRISKWDIHFENAWDQYYTGLDLYCDTFGQEKQIEVWVDEVRLTNELAGGLTYWPVVANGRKTVHLTLPWGRGHVFRFLAVDDNPGLLYTHRWHLQEEPSEQANWNQNFSILGTRADKWLKAIIFECDTFGADKLVQVEVDGTTVQTLTVNTNGRRVVQIALTEQHLGRVWRMFPVDANPGRLYTAEPIFDEEPFCFDRWETQETNHNLPGWFYPLYAHITLKSSADVTLTTVMQHNQVGGTTTRTYTIPSTDGQKQRRFLNGFHAGKGVLIKYTLTSTVPFWLYREETTVVIQPWGSYDSIVVQPFGNDDQDPSRSMTHAILAAQSSGGAVAPGQAG